MIDARNFPTSQSKPAIYDKFAHHRTMQRIKLPLLLSFLHIPVGLLLYRSSALALIFPLGVFLLGLYFAIRRREKLERVAYVSAYLVGAEVLWRMAQSSINYEFGKYGVAAIMIVALVQRRCWKIPPLPLLYIALLVPACFLTLINEGLFDAREKLSGNISGPFLLFISCWFFSYLKVYVPQLKRLLLTIIVPLISVGVTTLFYTLTIENINFNDESNFATSGGFGPNQVSTMLGLGAFICLACYFLFKNNSKVRVYLGVLTVFFAAQSVMTFSRSGMYNAVGAIFIVILFQTLYSGLSAKKVFPVVGIAVVFLLLVFPYLDGFTGGKLLARFEDSGTSNRAEIAGADFQLFLENPIFGTGVGEAKSLKKEILDYNAASHTEFARLLSEHGALGIFSLIALALGTIYSFTGQNSSMGKAFVSGVVVWSALYMLNSGMRLAAPAFMWGISFVTIVVPKKELRNFCNRQI